MVTVVKTECRTTLSDISPKEKRINPEERHREIRFAKKPWFMLNTDIYHQG